MFEKSEYNIDCGFFPATYAPSSGPRGSDPLRGEGHQMELQIAGHSGTSMETHVRGSPQLLGWTSGPCLRWSWIWELSLAVSSSPLSLPCLCA